MSRYLRQYWTCDGCGTLNYMSNVKCVHCDEPNPDNQPFGLMNLAVGLGLVLVLAAVAVWLLL